MTAPLYTRTDDRLGTFALRPVDPFADAEMLHRWVTHLKCVFWMMQDAKLPDVEREFLDMAARAEHEAYIGLHEGTPAFLVERYDPAKELGDVYEPLSGDIGMHFLCAPTETPLHGFTLAVLTTVMELLFADPRVERVIVEPDVRNTAVHALNEAVGFTVERTVSLPKKDALLSVCSRERYLTARGGESR